MKPWHVKDENRPDNDRAENKMVDRMHERECVEKVKSRIYKILETGWRFTRWDFVREWKMDEQEAKTALAELVESGKVRVSNGVYGRDDYVPRDTSSIDVEQRPSKPGETWGT